MRNPQKTLQERIPISNEKIDDVKNLTPKFNTLTRIDDVIDDMKYFSNFARKMP